LIRIYLLPFRITDRALCFLLGWHGLRGRSGTAARGRRGKEEREVCLAGRSGRYSVSLDSEGSKDIQLPGPSLEARMTISD